MHIQPDAYRAELSGEKSTSTQFIEDLEKTFGRKLTSEEIDQLSPGHGSIDDDDVDLIERING